MKHIEELEKKLETIQGCLKSTHSEGEFEQCTGMKMSEIHEAMAEGQRKGILK